MKLKEKFQRFWTLSSGRKGFTLVELIVVIAILAILAGVAIPVYNGYIKKANTAADQQLLDTINTAFVAACLENGISQYDLTSAQAKMPLSDGKVVVANVQPAALQEAFAFYYTGNENAAFNTFQFLSYDQAYGMFVDGGEGSTVSLPNGGTLSLNAEQLALIKNSTYSKDIGGLMTQVDDVSGLVHGLLNGSGDAAGAAAALLGFTSDEAYLTKAITALGGTVDPNGDLQAQYGEVVGEFKEQQAINKLAAQLGVDPSEIDINGEHTDQYNAVIDGIAAEVDKNILVLGIAQSAASQNKDGAMAIINSNDPKTELLNSMLGQGADTASGMGNAALVYGAFTAYANSDSATDAAKAALNNSSDPTAVFDILTGDELTAFQNYMNTAQGQTDIDACIAAMDVINSTATDPEAVSGIMANGFANDEFISALESLLK